ncbi:MAG: tRNA-dihydrouridine synthase family protein [Omnitrophica WOR_2 bacterium]
MEPKEHIYLAPFQGITNAVFRRVFFQHFNGISKSYTPFFAQIDHETRLSPRKEHELRGQDEGFPELVPQILSKDPVEILRFAHICKSRGFKELNWNIGCPWPQVADKKRGSGLLPFPEMIDDILHVVMSSMPLQFSIKCRLGYLNPEEVINLIPVFNKYPLHEITVHGRIGKQLYSGNIDHEIMSKIIPLIKAPFVYNGDIFTVEDFKGLSDKYTTVKRWMIGRGLLKNPFLAEEILGNEVIADKNKRLYSFLVDMYLSYRTDMQDRLTLLNILKEYWDYLGPSFNNEIKVKRLIKKVKTFKEYEDAVNKIFDECCTDS